MDGLNFRKLVGCTMKGGDEPIITCNSNGEPCVIPRFVLRGIYEGFGRVIDASATDPSWEEERIEWTRTIFHAVCDAALLKD